jgi:hypothetical protein
MNKYNHILTPLQWAIDQNAAVGFGPGPGSKIGIYFQASMLYAVTLNGVRVLD